MNRLPADRVLVIRFHAIGDTAITLPLASALAQHSPEIATDYLTTASAAPLVRALGCFREVHLFPACRTPLERFRAVVSVARTLRSREYTTVLDLQGNWASRMLRTLLRPAVWSEFDRFAPIPAGLRVRNAFASASFGNLESPISLPVRQQLCSRAEQILSDAGWDGKRRLAILNPAGLWKSRQWPDPCFAALA
ncbi:MAG: hypothetical protein OEV30_11995, partial [Ignavibacteria bacterium]|nr:hypothetical protein [Ignavibacteria bacterium]